MNNKGFSLVELIIVIAIMAILSAAIVPALIRYINKSKKADDIAAADSIGTMFEAAITEDEFLYECMGHYAGDTYADGREYRVVAFCNPGPNSQTPFHLPSQNIPAALQNNSRYGDAATSLQTKMSDYLGSDVAPLKFKSPTYLDQWVICMDKSNKISVWVGGGISDNDAWIMSDGTVNNNSQKQFYKLWPTVDAKYNLLTNPPRSWADGSS